MQVEADMCIYIYNPMDAMGRIGAFPTENLWIPRLGIQLSGPLFEYAHLVNTDAERPRGFEIQFVR